MKVDSRDGHYDAIELQALDYAVYILESSVHGLPTDLEPCDVTLKERGPSLWGHTVTPKGEGRGPSLWGHTVTPKGEGKGALAVGSYGHPKG